MAVKTFYFKDAAPSGAASSLSLQDGGTPPTAANTATGWTVGTSASPNFSAMIAGATRAASSFATADALGSFNANACWRSENPITGTFTNTAWSFAFRVTSNLASLNQTGKVCIRVFKSSDSAGSSRTELTSGVQNGSTTGVVNPSPSSQASTVTWLPGTVVFNSEYLWVQCEWSIIGVSASPSSDVVFYVESAGAITTPDYSASVAVTGTLAATEASDGASFPGGVGNGTLEAYEGAVWITADSEVYTADNDVVRVNTAGQITDTVAFTGTVTTVVTGTLAASEDGVPATFDGTPSASVVISNGKLTVTHGSTSNGTGVFSTAAKSTGKYHFEVKVQTSTSNANAIGIKLYASGVFSDPGGAFTGGVGVGLGSPNSLIYSNAVSTGKNLGVAAVNDVYSVAVDLDARLAWIRKNGGNWNADAAANPVTGTNGVAVPAGAMAPMVRFTNGAATDAFLGNFGQSAFAFAAPSGFSNWTAGVGTAGADAAAFTGLVGRSGTLAATEGSDTASFAGTVATPAITGVLAAIESADTAVFSGTVTYPAITGVLAATEGVADTAAFTGLTAAIGMLAATEGADTAAFTGVSGLVVGTLAVTEGADTASFAGRVAWDGILAATEGADTASFAGQLGAIGTLAATEAGDVLAADGYVSFVDEKIGILNAFESGGVGGVEEPTADSTLVTADQTIFTSDLDHRGTDTAYFTGEAVVGAVLAVTEEADSASFVGLLGDVTGVLAAQEQDKDTAAFDGGVAPTIRGVLAAREEAADVAYFVGLVSWQVVGEGLGEGLEDEVIRTVWLASLERRVIWLTNEVEDMLWLKNLEGRMVWSASEVQRITELRPS